jgi:hypothetical protein
MMHLTTNMAWAELLKSFFIDMKKILFLTLIFPSLPGWSADTTLIRRHFDAIINTDEPRNYENTKALNEVAAYIHKEFSSYGDSTHYQEFQVDGRSYKNVITSVGVEHGTRIIVGAHYDVCGDQDGADDNASGVIGLLELARMLKDEQLKYRIDLVAYTLEEPPYFGTNEMGSFKHAEYLAKNDIDVYGMVCLEMIGYFSDEKKSQSYPVGLLKLFYGGKGDYITIVRKFGCGKFAKRYKRRMKNLDLISTKSIQAPGALRGIDFSDHLNYWRFGFSAVMITNTGFYRNENYHQEGDVIETIDMARMGAVIDEVYLALKAME